jgi:hypothetical protein
MPSSLEPNPLHRLNRPLKSHPRTMHPAIWFNTWPHRLWTPPPELEPQWKSRLQLKSAEAERESIIEVERLIQSFEVRATYGKPSRSTYTKVRNSSPIFLNRCLQIPLSAGSNNSLSIFPAELLGVFGEILGAMQLYGTLSNLNVLSRSTRYATIPSMMHTVYARSEWLAYSPASMRELDEVIARRFSGTYQHIK